MESCTAPKGDNKRLIGLTGMLEITVKNFPQITS